MFLFDRVEFVGLVKAIPWVEIQQFGSAMRTFYFHLRFLLFVAN